jgi:N-acetylgalactosamine-N,N'-diacetylbacillosaminyl-diphospho-undecaprenol 4-alpha-N-acetylgalactosaminyltransferase
MKKAVSILIYSLASGGAERVVSILLNELKDEYNIKLVLMNDTIFYDIPNDIEIVYLEKSNPQENGILKLLKLPLLGYRYSKIKSDVSISFMNRPNYVNIFSKFFGKKSNFIISERAIPSLQHSSGIQGKINKFLIKSLYKYADNIIANSNGNSFDLIENFNCEKVVTIHNPFDVEKIINLSKENIEYHKDKFSFITIGRLDSGKNHKLLINSFSKLNIDANLYIIGEGELRSELENQIKTLNLEKKVFLLGRKENPYKYISKSDCFVFSSNYEGFPNVLLEALSCSIPIISTDCKSGPREILAPQSDFKNILSSGIEQSEYGILTTTNDEKSMMEAMKLMYENESLREEYKSKAQNRAKEFDKDSLIKEYIKIIEKF